MKHMMISRIEHIIYSIRNYWSKKTTWSVAPVKVIKYTSDNFANPFQRKKINYKNLKKSERNFWERKGSVSKLYIIWTIKISHKKGSHLNRKWSIRHPLLLSSIQNEIFNPEWPFLCGPYLSPNMVEKTNTLSWTFIIWLLSCCLQVHLSSDHAKHSS